MFGSVNSEQLLDSIPAACKSSERATAFLQKKQEQRLGRTSTFALAFFEMYWVETAVNWNRCDHSAPHPIVKTSHARIQTLLTKKSTAITTRAIAPQSKVCLQYEPEEERPALLRGAVSPTSGCDQLCIRKISCAPCAWARQHVNPDRRLPVRV